MSTRKKLLIAVIVLLLVAGLAAGILLVSQPQILPKKASTPTGTATIRLNPETKTVAAGTTFPVQMSFTTGGQPISAVTVQLDYPYTGTEPPIAVSSIQLNAALLATGEWSLPIHTVTTQNGHARIRIAAVNTSLAGFTATTESVLGTIVFQGNQTGTINVAFDATESKITNKGSGQDVLLTPASTGTYTVTGGTGGTTPAPTGTGAAGSPTPSPTGAPSGLSCSSLDIPGGTTRPAGDSIRFVCNGSPASLVTQCRFRFGDGSAEALDDDCNIFHTYATTGSFDVSCEVKDTSGNFKASSACANAMSITSVTNTPTPPGGSSSTTGSTPIPSSGVAWPTFLVIGVGIILLISGISVFLPR